MGGCNSKVLFKMGKQGYAVFRLPAIIYHNGVFLAFCEGRLGIPDDSVSHIVMRRGVQQDGKLTWSNIQVVAEIEGVRLANPVPFVDVERNVIWVLYNRTHGPEKLPQQLLLIKTTDLGITWSKPRDIREEVFNRMPKDVIYFTPGPAHGIQMKSGRLVIQGYVHVEDADNKTTMHAAVLLSDDHADKWYPGGIVPLKTKDGTLVETNENSVVELADDTLCLNSRTLTKDQPRAQSFSEDGGITFNSEQLVSTLIEPNNVCGSVAGCEGTLLGFDSPESAPKPWVLFSNPASTLIRVKMSIRLSQDGCVKWSKPWRIRRWGSGYSDMTQYDNDVSTDSEQNPTFAILYENGFFTSYTNVTFYTFNLEDVKHGIA